jgi:replicative DNA helicase
LASLSDKNAIMQVIGCLMKSPVILADSKYIITKNDFDLPLAKNIFLAIEDLFKGYNAENITTVDIDNYFQQVEGSYENFKKQNGQQYLNDCLLLSNINTFNFYYNRMKKLSALRALKRDGFDVSKIYNENELDLQKEKMQQEKLDTMSLQDIFDTFLKGLNDLQYDYICRDDSEEGFISDGASVLFEQLQENPEIGVPLQGEIYNTLVRGARLKKYYLISGASGTGKTRQMVGHACTIAFPERFDLISRQWVVTGTGDKILFFATEMEKEEIQTMILAHISAVNEDKILNNYYESPEEKQRVYDAIKIMEHYKDNFIFVRVGDPSIGQIKTLIRKEVLKHDIGYVFYDYIFSSPGLLAEYKDLNLREDVILMMTSIALKDLANELNIFMMSGTQLNEKWKEYKGIRDYNLIRGSKAIADKIDVGGISLPLTPEEHEQVDPIARKLGKDLPTQVQDMYKIRRGKYNRVRIWSKVDLGICRTEDLFLTDTTGNIIDITPNEYLFKDAMNSIINNQKLQENKKESEEIVKLKEKTVEKKVSLADLI